MSLLQHVIYINLDERIDRRDHFMKEWGKLGSPWNPIRQSATKMQQAAVGCSMSHIKALEKAKAEDWPQVVICEDDITFTDPRTLLQSLALLQMDDKIKTWDVLLLGGNNWPPFEKITGNCLQVHNCVSAVGYIVRRHYYDRLLENYRKSSVQFLRNADQGHLYSLDVYWRRLQIRDTWLFLLPATVDQWCGNYSDIEKREVTYSPLLLDPYKEQAWLQPGVRSKVMEEMKMLKKNE